MKYYKYIEYKNELYIYYIATEYHLKKKKSIACFNLFFISFFIVLYYNIK